MRLYVRMSIAAAAIAFFASGCVVTPGRVIPLNDMTRSKPGRDMANLFSPRDVAYESVVHGDILVGYNMFFAKNPNVSGYRLTLIFQNNSGYNQHFTPKIALRDAAGVPIRPYSYQAFTEKAAALAGTIVPPEPLACPCNRHYSVDTISNTTMLDGGANPTTLTDSPRNGYAKIISEETVSGSVSDREGLLMLLWANSFWLREAYDLPAEAKSWGALFFPAAALGELPLHLTVEIGGQKYEFDTRVEIARQ